MTRLASTDNGSDVRRTTLAGLVANLLLATLKFVVGTLTRSQALVADAAHSASDLATDVAILAGSHFWNAPPDANHPHGHRRIETLVSLGIGLAVVAVGVGLALEALRALWTARTTAPAVPPSLPVALCALASLAVKEALFHFTRHAARVVRSPALEANAWHHRSDAISSIPVLLAALLSQFFPSFPHFDTLGALIVSVLIIRSGLTIVRPELGEAADEGAPPETVRQLLELANAVPGVLSIHDFRTRRIGSDLQVTLHIVVNPDLTLHEAHDLSERVEHVLLSANLHVIDALVHVDPFSPEKAGPPASSPHLPERDGQATGKNRAQDCPR